MDSYATLDVSSGTQGILGASHRLESAIIAFGDDALLETVVGTPGSSAILTKVNTL